MMKNPFAKFKQRRREEKITIDWPHRYVVHEVLFDTPDALMMCPQYRAASEKDFEDILKSVRDTLGELDIDANSAHIFDTILRARQTTLLCDLAESRLLHLQNAIHLRTDAEQQYHCYEMEIQRLQALRYELEAEKRALQAEH